MSQQPYNNAGAGGNEAPSSWQQQPPRTPAYYEAYYERSGGGVGGAAEGGTIPGEYERAGEMQPRKCNDVVFALLFYANLGITAGLAAAFAPRMIGDMASSASSSWSSSSSDAARDLMPSSLDGNDARFASWMAGTARRFVLSSLSASHSYTSSRSSSSSSIGTPASDDDLRALQEDDGGGGGGGVEGTSYLGDMILLLGASTLIALLLSSGALGFMIRHAESLVKFALLFNVVCTAVVSGGHRVFSSSSGFSPMRLCTRDTIVDDCDRLPFVPSVATHSPDPTLLSSPSGPSSSPPSPPWWVFSFSSSPRTTRTWSGDAFPSRPATSWSRRPL